MKPVDVLGGVDGADHAALVDVSGERQLHQDAVDRRVGVELGDEGQQVGLGEVGGARQRLGVEARLGGGARLGADVGLRRRVLADEHDAQRGRAAVRGLEGGRARGDVGADGGGDLAAVEKGGGHRRGGGRTRS